VKASNLDIRKFPWFFADGDVVGVRLERENTGPEKDDFQTDLDLIAKADFNLIKEQKQKEQAEVKRNKNNKKANDEVSLYINLNDE